MTDLEGNFLDGEWTNPASITTVNSLVSTFPSGDGTAGGNFNFVMTLLAGDANLDGVVDISDYDIMVSNYISASDDDYNNPFDQLFEDGDFNGDGTVGGPDSTAMFSNWGLNLQTISVLADLNGDFIVDANDLDVITNNYGMTGATLADGDLNGDGVIGDADLDLAFEQFGLGLDWVA